MSKTLFKDVYNGQHFIYNNKVFVKLERNLVCFVQNDIAYGEFCATHYVELLDSSKIENTIIKLQESLKL